MRSLSRSDWLVWLVAFVLFGLVPAGPVVAQVRLSTLDDVRREVTPGDLITVATGGDTIAGRLQRWGDTDLVIRTVAQPTAGQQRRSSDVTIRVSDLQSLERPRDSSKNGALIGAAIGGGFVAGVSLAEDVDWSRFGQYMAVAAGYTGVGALLGWVIDRAHSKRHVRFDASSPRSARIHVIPLRAQGAGISLAVSY